MRNVRVTSYGARTCPLCRGRGCSECDDTGVKVTTHIDAGDDPTLTLRVSSSKPLSPQAVAALAELGRTALARMAAEHITTEGPTNDV